MKNYFTYAELTQTSTMMFNDVSCPEHMQNLVNLWTCLNQVRSDFGQPIIVNSAYRTKEVNKAVGGVYNSFHLLGRAADIRPQSKKYEDFLKLRLCLNRYKWTEYIEYDNFIHVAL